MLMEVFRIGGLLLGFLAVSTTSFVVPTTRTRTPSQQHRIRDASSPLSAGFGNQSSTTSSKGKKASKKKGATKKTSNNKLKPKKQWDRYMSEDLKSSSSLCVGVRVATDDADNADNANKWFSVGEIKSMDDAYSEAAVVRHRALIADHARRMFPAEVLAIDKLDFGYRTDAGSDGDATAEEECEWNLVGKIKESMPDDIDKLIGFRGFPDLTGFYTSSGKAATGDTKQDGYAKMKNKGITGITALEVHD